MEYICRVFCILAISVSFPGYCTGSIGRGSIVIQNNGYSNILISIAARVTPNNQLIERIKSAYTEASASLYEATRKRAYLHNITILVPGSWPSDPSYEPIKNETPDKSDIVVDNPGEGHGDRPYTVEITPCGEPGYYTHLTPAFLLDDEVASQFGQYGRVLLHEWSHLRYGVYDEYPSENDGQHFYAERDGSIEATRCSSALTGGMRTLDDTPCILEDGLPEPDCRFIDDKDLTGRYASVMYRSTLNHLFHFCDNDPADEFTYHNTRAPTRQNLMCMGRSVWEVLREHEDLFNGTNPPVELTSTIPNFRLVHQAQMQTVLVLDISSSMRGSRHEKLNQGCSTYISSIIKDGEVLAIVTFNSRSNLERDLTVISNDTRQYMLDGLPTLTSGSTSIGAGIRHALEALQRTNVSAGTLIVVSDGQENVRPHISDVWEEVLSSGVTVHAIAITDAADSNLDALAQATGGLSFIYSEYDNSNAINEAFRAIGELNEDPSERSYPLLSKAVDLTRNEMITEIAIIDESLGRDSQFIFDYSLYQGLAIEVHSPTDTIYDTSSPECQQDTTYRVYRFNLFADSGTGEWLIRVTNLATSTQSVSITVVSKSSTPGEYPIAAQAFWGRRDLHLIVPGRDPDKQALYASVSKGSMPVLYANVTATVERPNTQPVDVILNDNGAGADLIANDGIYSSYFIQFTDNGRYGVTVVVNNNPATVISPIRIIGQGVAIGQQRIDSVPDRPTGDFQRLVNGGSFELSDYGPGYKYLPGRIHDFRLTEVDRHTKRITLEWTAVGAQLDFDTLSIYDLRFSQDFDDLQNDFDLQSEITTDMIISGSNMTDPQLPGQLEAVTVLLPNSSQFTYYFAIKGVDLNGRNISGPMSNIVSATFREIVLPGDPEETNLGLILGVTFGILAFVIIVVTVSILVVKKVKRKPQSIEQMSSVRVEEVVNSGYDNKTFASPLDFE